MPTSYAMPTSSFNPRPTRKPGRHETMDLGAEIIGMFQSSPDSGAGRHLLPRALDVLLAHVSILVLTRKPGVTRAFLANHVGHLEVSILARLETPSVISPSSIRGAATTSCFNPRPTRK